MSKRIFDIVISSLVLIIVSPLLIIIAFLIKLGSPGPVFYRGVRAGRNRQPFRIFKFRSLIENAENLGGPSTAGDDQRLTPIGHWIRKYKLDELPQLFNVLKGEMSLVGPRPEVMNYATLYQGPEEIIYSIKPGVTDYASLWNIDEGAILKEAKTTEEIEQRYLSLIRPEKIRLQIKYIQEMSLLTDLKILARTAARILFP